MSEKIYELKSCPFCGPTLHAALKPQNLRDGNKRSDPWQVGCWKCGATGPLRSNKRDSARAWNNRAKVTP